MKRDILREIHDGTLSVEEADAIYDSIDSVSPVHPLDLLGLSDVESTAFASAVGFDELARWRYAGWPDICPVCGQKIEVEKFGWVTKEVDGQRRLVHISCLPGPSEEERQVWTEFEAHALPGFCDNFEREVGLRFIERADQLNVAVLLVYSVIVRDDRVVEAPRELMRSCWDEVPGETWEEFRAQCNACAAEFLRTVPQREGLAFDFELDSREKWPELRSRRKEIEEERRKPACAKG